MLIKPKGKLVKQLLLEDIQLLKFHLKNHLNGHKDMLEILGVRQKVRGSILEKLGKSVKNKEVCPILVDLCSINLVWPKMQLLHIRFKLMNEFYKLQPVDMPSS